MSAATLTSESICAELRGAAIHRADTTSSLDPGGSQRYRNLEFEVISESEFRGSSPDGDRGRSELSLILSRVENEWAIEFTEHWEGNSSVLVYWQLT